MEEWLERFALANFKRSADTAHDLKTPLNIAVLNLELLRMRLRKLSEVEDEKVQIHAQAIDAELRRLGRIFDAFFVLTVPPRDELAAGVDAIAIARAAADETGTAFSFNTEALVQGHQDRLLEMFRQLFKGGHKLLGEEKSVSAWLEAAFLIVEVAGVPLHEVDVSKVFKFYFSDRDGNPDLSLAVARLIAETYGGSLTAVENVERIVFRLSLPLGER